MNAQDLARRVAAVDWDTVTDQVNLMGGAHLGPLITPDEADDVRAMYDDPDRFRSTIEMARYRFGSGQYRYLAAPYPPLIDQLKQQLYPRLLPIARTWWHKLGRDATWPDSLEDWLTTCHQAGQSRSTATLLRYQQGDWNALHQDLYGDLFFPLQVVINLSRSGHDYHGGEFLLLEQRPRAQSRGSAFTIPHGHGFLFTTRERPVQTKRGWSAAPVRHGVSTITAGQRHTLGLVFHDAA